MMDLQLATVLEFELEAEVIGISPVGGGDFARSYRVLLDDRSTVFVKTHRDPPAEFFTTEALSLEWLRGTGSTNVPRVLAVGDVPAFLALEWIEVGAAHERTEPEFGRQLADLHRFGAPTFGRTDRRTTGSRALANDPASSWAEFYSTRRLLPLADLAASSQSLSDRTIADLRRLAAGLAELAGPIEPPALLHGDLWAGNRLVDGFGGSWVIDPAAFGGHREFDLSMMRLFGGFGADVFAAYDESFPLAEGWKERVRLNQVAPLVVHAIKFGGAYVGAASAAIATYL